jgi:hypothetical protein
MCSPDKGLVKPWFPLKPAGRRDSDGIKHNAGGDRVDHQMSVEQLAVTPGASLRSN